MVHRHQANHHADCTGQTSHSFVTAASSNTKRHKSFDRCLGMCDLKNGRSHNQLEALGLSKAQVLISTNSTGANVATCRLLSVTGCWNNVMLTNRYKEVVAVTYHSISGRLFKWNHESYLSVDDAFNFTTCGKFSK